MIENELKHIFLNKRDIFLWIIFACFFLIFNPYLAIFLSALLSTNRLQNNRYVFLVGILALSLFFYFRVYGVSWAEGSEDDVLRYVYIYEKLSLSNFSEVFTNFINYPGQNEPVWSYFWWLVSGMGITGFSFILLHYILNFTVLVLTFYILSKKNYLGALFYYLFISLNSIEIIGFLWRQQIAICIFIIGIHFFYNNRKKFGFLLILISPLIHLPSIIFTLLFIEYILFFYFQDSEKIINKIKLNVFNLILLIILFEFGFYLLTNSGLKSLAYDSENNAPITLKTTLSLTSYYIFFFYFYYSSKFNKFNIFISFILISIIPIFIIEPYKSTLFSRYQSYIYAFAAIFISVLLSKQKIIHQYSLMVIVFLFGIIRYYYQSNMGIGVFQYLAYGQSFDPFMGILKMLFLFL